MNDLGSYFAGKKITVMGLGLLGRGIGDAKYLASCGAELIVTDLKSKEQLAAALEELRDYPGITFVLGEHRLEDFRGRDLILKAAGVPADSEFIAEARAAGTPIRMSADLFAELSGIPIVGVTGTRGKSTTTYMIHDILTKAGKKTMLGGNVRGVSTLSLLSEVSPDSIGVLELDSWQLQGFGEANMSPALSVFTTFFPDHLNYYHNDLDAYLQDKAQIFLHQKPEDTLIVGEQCVSLIQEKYENQIVSHMSVVGTRDLPESWKLSIPGEHNRYDAALALAAARTLGVSDEVSREALESFPGVPGRLELVRIVDDVSFYNDSNATTPDATLAALAALGSGESNLVLIMGGADKGLDMHTLVEALPKYTKHVVLLVGTGTDRIQKDIPNAVVHDSLASAFADARAHAAPGGSVVLSPAFASFGMFKNEYDRGDQFTNLVRGV